MADRLDDLADRLEKFETRVGDGFKAFDARFDEVIDALVEQRKYTEFVYSKLDTKLDARP